ncbi:Uncharacterized protein FKW44_016597 [Caligus rogercresseyi]|uniref:Uncharacterized protein n=1 Tax=Caligus rogercresseyi TaxID=217165 RepID=A0A7T8H2Q2_CALRO|nr:Uncharacterized protein FKW44_016597 [Caligus rogercresseyi]
MFDVICTSCGEAVRDKFVLRVLDVHGTSPVSNVRTAGLSCMRNALQSMIGYFAVRTFIGKGKKDWS